MAGKINSLPTTRNPRKATNIKHHHPTMTGALSLGRDLHRVPTRWRAFLQLGGEDLPGEARLVKGRSPTGRVGAVNRSVHGQASGARYPTERLDTCNAHTTYQLWPHGRQSQQDTCPGESGSSSRSMPWVSTWETRGQ